MLNAFSMKPQRDATLRWATTLIIGFAVLFQSIIYVFVERQLAMHLPGVVVSAWWYVITGCLPVICILTAIVFRKSHAIWKRDYVSGVLGVLAILSFAMQFPMMYSLCGFENAYRQLELKKNSGN